MHRRIRHQGGQRPDTQSFFNQLVNQIGALNFVKRQLFLLKDGPNELFNGGLDLVVAGAHQLPEQGLRILLRFNFVELRPSMVSAVPASFAAARLARSRLWIRQFLGELSSQLSKSIKTALIKTHGSAFSCSRGCREWTGR